MKHIDMKVKSCEECPFMHWHPGTPHEAAEYRCSHSDYTGGVLAYDRVRQSVEFPATPPQGCPLPNDEEQL